MKTATAKSGQASPLASPNATPKGAKRSEVGVRNPAVRSSPPPWLPRLKKILDLTLAEMKAHRRHRDIEVAVLVDVGDGHAPMVGVLRRIRSPGRLSKTSPPIVEKHEEGSRQIVGTRRRNDVVEAVAAQVCDGQPKEVNVSARRRLQLASDLRIGERDGSRTAQQNTYGKPHAEPLHTAPLTFQRASASNNALRNCCTLTGRSLQLHERRR